MNLYKLSGRYTECSFQSKHVVVMKERVSIIVYESEKFLYFRLYDMPMPIL